MWAIWKSLSIPPPQLFLVQDLNARWQYMQILVSNLMIHVCIGILCFKNSIFRQLLTSLGSFAASDSKVVSLAKKAGYLTGTKSLLKQLQVAA